MGSWSWAAASPWVCAWPEAVCNGRWLAFLQLRAALVKLSLWPLLPSMQLGGKLAPSGLPGISRGVVTGRPPQTVRKPDKWQTVQS